jgi:dihydrofolate synthase/folylpolyglutamate synthase
MPSAAEAWIESLSPWPREFGLGRMRELLGRLGEPQLAYPAIHVVGTNGKSTTTRTTEELLRREGLRVGAYLSPHVRGWSERIRVDGAEADLDRVLERVRPAAEELGATQFEILTAAALAEFAAAQVDVAVVEAGLGGRLDATNVLQTRVVVLTNVALEHTQYLGETREEIAREKLAVVQPGAHVVVGEPEWAEEAVSHGACTVNIVPDDNAALAAAAASAFLGRPVEPLPEIRPPGRFELRGERPLEMWDGAHNPAGLDYQGRHLPERRDWVIVASVLGDRRADRMLKELAEHGRRLVATTSSNPRALAADDLRREALDLDPRGPHFSSVWAEPDPVAALERARALAGPDGAVLVTGSLYLLADLSARIPPWQQDPHHGARGAAGGAEA